MELQICEDITIETVEVDFLFTRPTFDHEVRFLPADVTCVQSMQRTDKICNF